MSDELPSFNKNYEVLRSIASQLSNQEHSDVPDIDNLLPMVEGFSTLSVDRESHRRLFQTIPNV